MGSQTLSLTAALLAALMLSAVTSAEGVPFPKSLERAAVAIATLDEAINDALILGNGDVNGLLFAEGDDLVFRITKNDVWDARLDTPLDPPLPTLARLKELGAGEWKDKGWILPEGSDWQGPDSYHAHAYPCPRACGVIRIPGAATRPLVARLDIRRAAAQVHAATGSASCRTAANANVIVFNSEAAPLLEPVLSDDIPAPKTGDDDGLQWLTQDIPGDLDWPGMQFAVVCAKASGRAAVAVATSRESADPLAAAKALAQDHLKKDADKERDTHEQVWEAFWSKSGIAVDDEILERLWYRNLYFLRCVTKEGVVSPGLFAGLMNDKPMWHGDYHTNYNIQQTFWAAYAANQCELAEPYDRLISEYLPRARWLARQIFDMDGAFFPHVLYAYEPTDPAECKSPNGRQYIHHVWAFTMGVAGFTVQPLWWRYKHQPDPVYLEKTAYPAVRDVAVFYADFVEQCERGDDGRVVLAPTVSPEHHGWTKRFRHNRNGTFCLAYFHAIFDAATEGAQTLERDAGLVARWQEAKALLPPYPTCEVKDTGEIVVDMLRAQPITYNIPVPTTPIFPADQVGWFSSRKQKALFAKTLSHLQHNGNNSAVMLAVARARLGTPDAYDWLRTELDHHERRNGTLTLNRLDPQFRFNDFGHYTEMFGAVLPISELLMQSVGDVIRVFPAWPAHRSARFEQLRAQGGFLVTAEHVQGAVKTLHIESTVGGPLRLMAPWAKVEMKSNGDGPWKEVRAEKRRILLIDTQPGQTHHFRPAASTRLSVLNEVESPALGTG